MSHCLIPTRCRCTSLCKARHDSKLIARSILCQDFAKLLSATTNASWWPWFILFRFSFKVEEICPCQTITHFFWHWPNHCQLNLYSKLQFICTHSCITLTSLNFYLVQSLKHLKRESFFLLDSRRLDISINHFMKRSEHKLYYFLWKSDYFSKSFCSEMWSPWQDGQRKLSFPIDKGGRNGETFYSNICFISW